MRVRLWLSVSSAAMAAVACVLNGQPEPPGDDDGFGGPVPGGVVGGKDPDSPAGEGDADGSGAAGGGANGSGGSTSSPGVPDGGAPLEIPADGGTQDGGLPDQDAGEPPLLDGGSQEGGVVALNADAGCEPEVEAGSVNKEAGL